MMSGQETYLDRRNVLKVTGGLVSGTTALGQLGNASAQNADASITLNDQESDGDSIVISSLQSDVDGRLFVTAAGDEAPDPLYKKLDLSAGTSFNNRTVQLDKSIQESKKVGAVIQAGTDYDQVIAHDTALIAVGESLAAARSSQISGGEIELVAADPDAGFHYPYVLYRPETQQNTERPLFVVPHNSRRAASRDELVKQLYQRAEGYLRTAIALSLPGLLAGFPRTPKDGRDLVQTLSLENLDTEAKRQAIATDAFPAETLHRVDRQLLHMLEDARERLGDEPYSVDDGIHMDGFSASGTFSSRFAFLYPDRVGAISVGGGGARPLPLDSKDGITLPYPIGTADYQEWTGRSFDRDAWTEIDQYIYVGDEDQPLPETDPTSYYGISSRYQDRAEEVYGINRVKDRFPVTRSVYNTAGANATFRIYDGVGHTITKEIQRDITQFHQRTSDAQHALFELTLQRSADQVTVGTPVTVTVQVQNRVPTNATAAPTFAVDGAGIETIERAVAPNGSTELTFNHTFDEPGSYNLSINGRQIGDGPITVVASTPTATATSTPTASPTSTPSVQPSETTETRTSEGAPGFGVGTALAGVAGLSYLLLKQGND